MAKAAKSKGIRALNAGVFVDVFENRALVCCYPCQYRLAPFGGRMGSLFAHQGSTTRDRECYSSIYQGLVCGFRKYPLDGLVCRVYAVEPWERIAGVERAKVRQARALDEDWHLLFLQRSSTILVAPSLNFSMARVSNKTDW